MKMSDSAFEDLKALDLGLKQRLSVRQCMKSLVDEGIPVYYTPGNHDIGDDPDDEMLKRYMSGSAEEEGWGPLFQKVDVEESGIRFLQFNSQVWWDFMGFGPSILRVWIEHLAHWLWFGK